MHVYSSLIGGFGLVFVVFGLLSVILLLFGAPTDLHWIVLNFVLGIALLAVWLATNLAQLRERMASGEARRVGTYGTSSVLTTVFAIAILGMLAFLSTRYHHRFDWSEAGVHSLSQQTQNVLENLEETLEIVGFYAAVQAAPVRALLDRYRYASDRVEVEIVDPTARPDLAERYGYSRESLGRGLLRIAIGAESVEVDEPSEERITNAILQLTRTQEKKVYFLTGHNERPIVAEGEGGATSLQVAATALRNENYRVEELLLPTAGAVPDDADVVIIAGPTRPFLDKEHDALRAYVERGGSLLVMLEPRARTDLYEDLETWGVDVGNDVVIAPRSSYFGRAEMPVARQFGDHPITRDLREAALFFVARTVQAGDASEAAFTELVLTGSDSWAETNLELWVATSRVGQDPEEDRAGPLAIGVAGALEFDVAPASREADDAEAGDEGAEDRVEARLVVFGDSDFASDQLIEGGSNRDLFVNSVNWLLGDVEAISIRPTRSRASSLQLSAAEFNQIRYLTLFVLPEAIALLGVFAWWSRRRAPGR
ncbi:MAG: Gldg family protein [Deltaproteobacteria bacterium]|nr:MAG: Gldg family protein [Deltaproteobacteria bacterium]